MSDAKYPSNPWGPFASDPWSPILDMGTGDAFDAAVRDARRIRLAEERADLALREMEEERQRSKGQAKISG